MCIRDSLYQWRAADHILDNTHCGLFLDMGLGKTVSTLTAINILMYEELEVGSVLVIAPNRVAESVWTAEIEKWKHLSHLKIVRVIGTQRDRLGALKQKADIHVIGRDNVAWLCGQYGGSALPWDMLVIDEFSSFKSPKSLRFKTLRKTLRVLKRSDFGDLKLLNSSITNISQGKAEPPYWPQSHATLSLPITWISAC